MAFMIRDGTGAGWTRHDPRFFRRLKPALNWSFLEMEAQKITLIAASMVLAAILGEQVFLHTGQSVKTSLKLDEAVGEVVAEETLKLMDHGQIVVVTEDTTVLLNRALDLQVKSFQETLNKQRQLTIAAIEKVVKEPLLPPHKPEPAGLSKEQLFAIVQAHPGIAGVVSFIGFPSLDPPEAASLKIKPLKYVIVFNSPFGVNFDRLGSQQIVNLAIVARDQPLEGGGKPPRTARERFDQSYGVIDPGSTN
jgi:hypothetical protein